MIEGNIDANTAGEQIIDSQTSLAKTQVRFSEALREHYQYDTSIKRGQSYLLKHVGSKVSLVIIYIDIVESTNLSMTLPAEKLVTIIRAFSHEMSAVAKSYNGYGTQICRRCDHSYSFLLVLTSILLMTMQSVAQDQ